MPGGRPPRTDRPPSLCTYEHCERPTESSNFFLIEEGRTSGGQDWSSVTGNVLCRACYSRFRDRGTLERERSKPLPTSARRCTYEHCDKPDEGNKFFLIEEGKTSGGQDWSSVVGHVLCKACYDRFYKRGTLGKKVSKDEQDNDWVCAYEKCSNPTESSRFYMIEEGKSAGGQDWSSVVGYVLCDACYCRYKRRGTLQRVPGGHGPGKRKKSKRDVDERDRGGGRKKKTKVKDEEEEEDDDDDDDEDDDDDDDDKKVTAPKARSRARVQSPPSTRTKTLTKTTKTSSSSSSSSSSAKVKFEDAKRNTDAGRKVAKHAGEATKPVAHSQAKFAKRMQEYQSVLKVGCIVRCNGHGRVRIVGKVPRQTEWWDVMVLSDQSKCQLELPFSEMGSMWEAVNEVDETGPQDDEQADAKAGFRPGSALDILAGCAARVLGSIG